MLMIHKYGFSEGQKFIPLPLTKTGGILYPCHSLITVNDLNPVSYAYFGYKSSTHVSKIDLSMQEARKVTLEDAPSFR